MNSNKIVECIPNFSEGRNREAIDRIASAIRSTVGVSLKNVDIGAHANRTVMTLIGEMNAVFEAMEKAIEVAFEVIDMRNHHGIHPRFGAIDVCPFVPISNCTFDELIPKVNAWGEKVGNRFQLPIYLYEKSATNSHRKSLKDVRQGEYEAIESKISLPEWAPDLGPSVFNPKMGNMALGVRNFLIAYNVNINSTSVAIAKKIAAEIRESGLLTKQADGSWHRIPGRCKGVKAIGWFIDDFGIAQVSMNLCDITQTSMHEAFERCEEIAQKHGARVTGSELIGMVPKHCMIEAGTYFIAKQKIDSSSFSENELAFLAMKTMGLNEVKPFDINMHTIDLSNL
jgi:glutamate formiminotransferase/formiminotetrahydrofolate cyclodeaminase